MWRDDGTRSAVKQSYRRVTVLVHGIPSLLSFLSPAKLPSHRRGDGREGRDLGGGACTTLLLLLLCSCESTVPRSWRGHSYYKLYYMYHSRRENEEEEEKK